MLLYCNNDVVLAIHDDAQDVALSRYAVAVRVIPVPNDFVLERVGPTPTPPIADHRPYAIPAATPSILIAYAADTRWRVATGGTTVGGLPVKTDDVSRADIAHLKQAFDLGEVLQTSFKAADGSFHSVNATQMTAINAGVVAHRQACFAAEASVVAAINAGTVTTYAAVDAAFSGIA